MPSEREKGIQLFKKSLKEIDLILETYQIEQFLDFYDLIIEKNKVMNLTTITEFNDVVVKHFIDSLVVNKVFNLTDERIIDVGTGAGFPGIPMKIAFPDTRMVLLDSLKKRIKFLDEVIEQCSLIDIETVHGRAEDLGKSPNYRDGFDICVSRAVANLSSLTEYCLPFVKKDGYFISYKAEDVTKEVLKSKNAIRILGGELEEIKELTLPGSNIKRSLIIIKKKRKTPKDYPRTAGKPTRDPL